MWSLRKLKMLGFLQEARKVVWRIFYLTESAIVLIVIKIELNCVCILVSVLIAVFTCLFPCIFILRYALNCDALQFWFLILFFFFHHFSKSTVVYVLIFFVASESNMENKNSLYGSSFLHGQWQTPCHGWRSFHECTACERAHLWVTCASGEEQNDPAGRNLVTTSLVASPLDFALAATPRALAWACLQATMNVAVHCIALERSLEEK